MGLTHPTEESDLDSRARARKALAASAVGRVAGRVCVRGCGVHQLTDPVRSGVGGLNLASSPRSNRPWSHAQIFFSRKIFEYFFLNRTIQTAATRLLARKRGIRIRKIPNCFPCACHSVRGGPRFKKRREIQGGGDGRCLRVALR
jgi:hypothetical protein